MALVEPKVTVAPLLADERETWAAFLRTSSNATFYHDLAFGEVHASRVDRIVNLVFRDEDRVLALLPAGLAMTPAGLELRSPFSASFAGFALGPRLSLRHALAIVSELLAWASRAGVRRIVLQQPPAIYARHLDETIEFALRHAGFEQIATEVTYYLDSVDGVDETVRRNARHARAAGCRFAETDDLDGVWQFLSAEKDERGHPFDIGRESLLALRGALPDRVRCFEVVGEGGRAAALLAYALNARVVLGFHWAQRAEAQQHRPTDLLLLDAIGWALAAGFGIFDLGTTTLGGEPAWGVTRFKEKFRPLAALRRRFAKTTT
jgi:GNAT acetyltransferase-like protein